MLAAMEVPIIGSDAVKFTEVSVPSSYFSDASSTAGSLPFAPSTRDYASYSAFGDSTTYIVWRVQKASPNALEIFELTSRNDLPKIGLRIIFSDALFPFAFIFRNEASTTSRFPYSLYSLTVSGVAYLLKIRHISTYSHTAVILPGEVIEFNLQSYTNGGSISSVAAVGGCLVVGRSDGSVGCFKLGVLDQNESGFYRELREDTGIGRFLGFMSRARPTSSVQDLVISELHGKQLLFVLHQEGLVQVWDLSTYYKIFNHSMSLPTISGVTSMGLWLGQFDSGSGRFPMAILFRHEEFNRETIYVCNIGYSLGDKINLFLELSSQNIPLEEGGCLDVKFTSDKIWILKDNGLVSLSLVASNAQMEEADFHGLQEEFVADQLFQSSEHSFNALLWIVDMVFPSSKDLSFISSIFLRRLLHPGVYHEIAFRATLFEYGRHWTEPEFQALTADRLKMEILSLIEQEGVIGNSLSIFNCCKSFCIRYFHYWCKENAPCSLFVGNSTGAVGLIRKKSVSLFRQSECIELLMDGSSDELRDIVKSGLGSGDDNLDWEILSEVVKCINIISQHVGKTSSVILYEALANASHITYEDIITRILKILENGHSSSVATVSKSDLVMDPAWECGLSDHKNLQKVSINMLLSLLSLSKIAATWGRVLNAVESFIKFLVPGKVFKKLEANILSDIGCSILVQATCQIAKVMFESALDVLLFLSYLVNNSGQINMLHDDKVRIQLDLIPMIEAIICEWHIVHFVAATPSESPTVKDFSSQLSLLQLDTNDGKELWKENLGKCNFTVAFVILFSTLSTPLEMSYPSSRCFPNPNDIVKSAWNFISWMMWLNTGEASSFLNNKIDMALILLKLAQYDVVEYLLHLVEANSRNKKTSQTIQETDRRWCMLQHLLGCCLLSQAHYKLNGMQKEKKVHEAACCFFRCIFLIGLDASSTPLQSGNHHLRLVSHAKIVSTQDFTLELLSSVLDVVPLGSTQASSGNESSQALGSLCLDPVSAHVSLYDSLSPLSLLDKIQAGRVSGATWRFHYYQWVMMIFEQYNISEAACEFALAALELVDEAISSKDDYFGGEPSNESATSIKGRLWGNVFKFTLDLNCFYDAYCAIISNPDEESKYICLRRFLIILYEHGAMKILCGGHLPFIGLTEKIEVELARKAECADILSKPNLYKLLYAFEMHQKNWRKAASYIYYYATRLRREIPSQDNQDYSMILQDRLNGLSAAINALHLIHPMYAWIDLPEERNSLKSKHYPSKKFKYTVDEKSGDDVQDQKWQSHLDLDRLEDEFVLASGEYHLSLANVKCPFTGNDYGPSTLVDLLVQNNLYDTAFTVLLRFWRGSSLKREMEKVFSAMSLKCCSKKINLSSIRCDYQTNGHLLASSNDNAIVHYSPGLATSGQQSTEHHQWEALELYLRRYKGFHERLPVVVAETLLHTDPQIEIPLWLVRMFKDGKRERTWGMTGQESDPASLLRLYVNYGRYTEATNLLLEYIESFASVQPEDLVYRKRPFAVWFPYTTIERLWCQLEELISLGHMVNQCNKLKELMHGALMRHLKMLKTEEDDALSAIERKDFKREAFKAV